MDTLINKAHKGISVIKVMADTGATTKSFPANAVIDDVGTGV